MRYDPTYKVGFVSMPFDGKMVRVAVLDCDLPAEGLRAGDSVYFEKVVTEEYLYPYIAGYPILGGFFYRVSPADIINPWGFDNTESYCDTDSSVRLRTRKGPNNPTTHFWAASGLARVVGGDTDSLMFPVQESGAYTSDKFTMRAGVMVRNKNTGKFVYGSYLGTFIYLLDAAPHIDNVSGAVQIAIVGRPFGSTSGDAPHVNVYGEMEIVGAVAANTDPYNPIGDSQKEGGDGDLDDDSEDIDFSDPPAIGAANSGFVSLYVPTEAELKALANYMWDSTIFDVSTFQKLFANPMDAILGLSVVPVAPIVYGRSALRIGNVTTTVSMNYTREQYVTLNCGTINVGEFSGSYLDYDPHTKYDIYLPYIGTRPLSADDVTGKAVTLKYIIDIITGACVAEIKCGGTVLYSFSGQCASPIPLTSLNWSSAITGAMTIGASIGSALATGGATAPFAAASIASASVNALKPTIEKSGSLGSTAGLMGLQTPYIIRTRPRAAVPNRQNEYTGYPSFITAKFADLNGYTEVNSMHLENIPATSEEMTEIENILKSGVIF